MDLQAPLGNLSSTQKDQLMTEVKQQIAVANAQELVTVSFKWWYLHGLQIVYGFIWKKNTDPIPFVV